MRSLTQIGQTSDVPFASDAERPYRGDLASVYHQGKRSIPERAIPWVCRARAELFQPQVKPDHVVFEFGCGWGWNLGALQCARRLGHDLAPMVPPALARLGIEFVEHTERIPDGSCDRILCHHALEHVLEPSGVLEELRRLVRPDGRLLLAVPEEREARYRRFDPCEPNHHLYSWTVQTLAALVTVCGWRVEEAGVRRYGYDRRAAFLADRFGWGEAGFRNVRWGLRSLRPIREVVVSAVAAS